MFECLHKCECEASEMVGDIERGRVRKNLLIQRSVDIAMLSTKANKQEGVYKRIYMVSTSVNGDLSMCSVAGSRGYYLTYNLGVARARFSRKAAVCNARISPLVKLS